MIWLTHFQWKLHRVFSSRNSLLYHRARWDNKKFCVEKWIPNYGRQGVFWTLPFFYETCWRQLKLSTAVININVVKILMDINSIKSMYHIWITLYVYISSSAVIKPVLTLSHAVKYPMYIKEKKKNYDKFLSVSILAFIAFNFGFILYMPIIDFHQTISFHSGFFLNSSIVL